MFITGVGVKNTSNVPVLTGNFVMLFTLVYHRCEGNKQKRYGGLF